MVLGLGFGGLEVVRGLKHAPVDVLVVDQNNYHLFTPLLYQVGSATLDPSEIARPARAMLRRIPNADFRLARVTSIDLENHRLETEHGSVSYDYLVVASGSINNYFGNRPLESESFGLKNLGEALALRIRILKQFEQAAWTTDEAARRRLLSFAVVGGGPTGVEYSGALSELIYKVLAKDFRNLAVNEARIVLIEGSDSLLGPFHPSLREAALRTLRKRKVEVVLGGLVKAYDDGRLSLADGRQIEAGTVIWTAGVRGSVPDGSVRSALGRQDRLKVGPTLQLESHPEVFVVGDVAGITENGKPLPMMIPPAQQEGRLVASNLRRLIEGRPLVSFRYRDPGMMATIGRNSGVAQLGASGRLRFSGFIGWAAWLGFHLLKVISFRNRLVVLVNWATEYFFYDRPVRLITKPEEPRLEQEPAVQR